MKTIRDYIRIYNHETSAVLAEVISLKDGWKTHGWYDATSGKSSSYETKELDIRHIEDKPALQQACSNIAYECAKLYANELMEYAMITRMSLPRLNRYETGTVMRIHSDHIHSLFDGENKGIPAITVLCALNDNYEGGEFVLAGEKIPLKAGDVIVFPSCFMYPHEVLEVTRGTRYSFVCWAW